MDADAKQPLLPKESNQDVYTVLYDDPNADVVFLQPNALRRHRRRRLRIAGCHVVAIALLTIMTFAYWTQGVLQDLFSGTGRTAYPLSGDLALPGYAGPAVSPDPVSFPLTFGLHRHLTVRQTIHEHHGDEHGDRHWRRVSVGGDVVFRAVEVVDGRNSAAPSVVVESVASDERIHYNVTFDATLQTLLVAVHDRVYDPSWWPLLKPLRLALRVTVWVPTATAPAQLEFLHVSTVQLGIKLADNVRLYVANALEVHTVSGSIVAAQPLDGSTATPAPQDEKNPSPVPYDVTAPLTDVMTVSGQIRGAWSLWYRLVVHSVSGSVGITYVALPAATTGVDLADVEIKTVSGRINFRELEPADTSSDATAHTLHISSSSGAVEGLGVFTSSAQLNTVSGSIHAALHIAHGAVDPIDKVTTETVSGRTTVVLTAAAAAAAGGEKQTAALDYVESNHKSVSGSINLQYPADWAGRFLLESLSGALEARGSGVVPTPDKEPAWPPAVGRKLNGSKGAVEGKEQSRLVGHTQSGSISLAFPV